jgi:hypothetical protein
MGSRSSEPVCPPLIYISILFPFEVASKLVKDYKRREGLENGCAAEEEGKWRGGRES